jgi:hypothetical protein
MALKAFLAAAAAVAIAVGFALPVPQQSEAATHSQIETLSLGRG